ncbi:hypothetical protein K8P10_002782 [Leucobacter sp. Psy1]|uniref:3-methyladenine DNA glycosylase n=1 Tax=Leucobacter sp. Psy1 TaxID=2875729 RepID=UPI00351D2640|nr:hypothetical protein K8P10_002782 [Leucobacter sp. Psy1]
MSGVASPIAPALAPGAARVPPPDIEEPTRLTRLPEADWRSRERVHAERADSLTAAHRLRKSRGETHPIEDFLFTYYTTTPGQLRRWHPGAGVSLVGAGSERAGWRHYRAGTDATVDLTAYFAKRAGTVDYVESLLERTLDRPPRYGCFGLHEWAMVYQMTPEQLRHRGLELRIGHAATDAVVDAHPIVCTHFDAYRFFTDAAAPLNELTPTRETQRDLEQSGCLHAGMDVYKWAAKLGPIVPGEVLLDAFQLASEIRRVDMRASPYDVSGYGLAAIPIETPEGKREYATTQRGFAERGDALRRRVLAAIAAARAARAAEAEAAATRPS